MKRFVWYLGMMLALVCTVACAESAGYAAVFDRSQDTDCLTVRFLDLGEPNSGSPGDCTVITSPDGEYAMVVDAGLKTSLDRVMGALNAMGLKRIDYLIVSHPHGDHTGCMPEIMGRFEVGMLITSAMKDESAQNYIDYMEAMRRHGIEHHIVAAGDTIPFGDVTVDVLWPEAEIDYPENTTEMTAFVNNHSLTLKFTYGESTLMLSGDLYMAGESLVIKKHGDALHADVIKLNHHGKDTSSGLMWRRAVSAEVAVAEADTLYDPALLKRFARDGEVYHTMLDGNICIHMYADGTRQVVREKADEHPMLSR